MKIRCPTEMGEDGILTQLLQAVGFALDLPQGFLLQVADT